MTLLRPPHSSSVGRAPAASCLWRLRCFAAAGRAGEYDALEQAVQESPLFGDVQVGPSGEEVACGEFVGERGLCS